MVGVVGGAGKGAGVGTTHVQTTGTPRAGAVPSARRSVLAVVLGMALLQALWVTTVPPFRASDEFDHAYRAAAVAEGEWWASEPVADGRGVLVRVPAHLVEAAHEQCADLDYTGPDNCTAVSAEEDGTVQVGSGAATYNPAFYWVVGTLARPFEGATALYVMRAGAALLCLLFLGLAAWALTRARARSWPLVGLVLAVTPVFVFSTSVAAPNGLEMSAALALWAALLVAPDVPDRRTRERLVAAAGIAGAVLATPRMLGPLFVVLIVAVALVFHGRAGLRFAAEHRRVLARWAAMVVVAVAAAAAWTLRAGLVDGSGRQEGGSDWSPTTLVLWPLQTIAAFPFRDIPGPPAVYVVVGGLVAALTVVASRAGVGRQRLALWLALVGALALPVVLTALSKGGRGVMWQGRYGLPLAVGFVLVAALVLAAGRARPSARLVLPSAGALAAVTAACLLKVRGDELARAVSAGDPAWHPPAPWLVVALSLAAWALFAGAVLRSEPAVAREPGS